MNKGTTKSRGQKSSLDKFYTNKDVSKRCIDLVGDLSLYDDIIEPSAGSGSFSSQIKSCLAFDLEPEGEGIKQADWFKVDKSQFSKNSLVIGNPPFGVQSNLAVDFFNESAKFAKTIAFILPLSFKKDSVQNRLDLNFELINEFVLERNSFTLDGNLYDVPSVFQVWQRAEVQRKKISMPMTSSNFDFTDRDKADIRVPRVGGNAGRASLDLNGAKSSNYFIRNKTKLSNEDFVELINSITFPGVAYTVGPKSLPKGEMVYEIDSKIKEMEELEGISRDKD